MKNQGIYAIPRNVTASCPTMVRGEGIYLYDKDGNRYIDGTSGSALVCNIGHGVEAVAAVMTPQALQLAYNPTHCSVSDAFLELAGRIARLAPGKTDRVYTVSGGSEATESAMRFARQYQIERGLGQKYEVISRWQSFHGNTGLALSVSGHTNRRRKYAPLLKHMAHIPPAYCYRCPFDLTCPACNLNCARALETAILQSGPENVAAFIAEPVVGSALGAVPAPEGYFQVIREICDRYDVLFIADEVMTGFGRTGKNFGVEHWGVDADFIAAAKGISGGYVPLGAVLISSDIMGFFEENNITLMEGHSYAGHLLSSRVGSAVLDYLESNNVVENCRIQGDYLLEGLKSLEEFKIVGDTRGKGLMTGLELVKDKQTKRPFPSEIRAAARIVDVAMKNGLIVYGGAGSVNGIAGDHLMIGPPLTVSRNQVEEIVTILRQSIETVERELLP